MRIRECDRVTYRLGVRGSGGGVTDFSGGGGTLDPDAGMPWGVNRVNGT